LTSLMSDIEPFVQEFGLLGLFFDLFFESFGIPLPGETILIVAAGLAGAGKLNIVSVAIVAFVASVAGDNVGFLLGRKFGRPAILRYGARFGITDQRLKKAERIMDRRGMIVVGLARFVVLLRQLNGLAAGTSGMHWFKFLVANAVGGGLWVGFWTYIAYVLGGQVDLLPDIWHWLFWLGGLLVMGLIVGLVLLRLFMRRGRKTRDTDG